MTFPEILNLNHFAWDEASSEGEGGENKDPANMCDDSGGGACGGGGPAETPPGDRAVNGHCSTDNGCSATGVTTVDGECQRSTTSVCTRQMYSTKMSNFSSHIKFDRNL